MRIAKLGKPGPWRGKTRNEATKRKITATNKRKRLMPPHDIRSTGKDHPRWKGGLPKCLKCKINLSNYKAKYCSKHKGLRGENSPNWKGGIGTQRHQAMGKLEYRIWREAVFARDDWRCIHCGDKSKKGHIVYLEADHIKPWALYPEFRYAIDNGRTLCIDCHRQTDTWGYTALYRKESD